MNKNSYFKMWSKLTFLFCLLVMTLNTYAQSIAIEGKVSDTKGEVLIGVTVLDKKSGKGTVTDLDGKYQMNVTSKTILQFSYVGYANQEVKVTNQKNLDVVMQEDSKLLDEVVVVGYGTFRKRDVTGAVSQVKADKFAKESPNSIQDILRGNVPGLNIGYSGAAKGVGDIQIRGQRSISASSTPLIVLDGVIYDGDLADISPQDIAQVDVLKDASSAAVYGAKSANGVILITSKKGKTEKPQINFNASYGFTTRSINSNQSSVYDASNFLEWRKDVKESSNRGTLKPYQYSDPRTLPDHISIDDWLAYDNSQGDPTQVWLRRIGLSNMEIQNYLNGKSIDWEDLTYQTGIRQDYRTSISGKTNKVSYYWSLGFTDNEGLFVGENYHTFRTRVNLEADVTNWLKVGIMMNFADRDESSVSVDVSEMRENSPFGSLYNDDGNYRLYPSDDAQIKNPFIDKQFTDQMKKYQTLQSTIFAKLTLPFGITYQMNFSPRYEWYNYGNHQSSEHPEWIKLGGRSERVQKTTFAWQVDNLIKWSKTFNKIHELDATFLVNAEKLQSWRTQQNNQGYPNDVNGWHQMNTGNLPTMATEDIYTTGDALMGRLHYALMERYMLTATVRRDGYSAFGQKNPHALFPSFAGAWMFSKEKFMKQIAWVDYSKLRVSWGRNGNRDIDPYIALPSLDSGKYIYSKPDGTVYSPVMLFSQRMGNSKLKWETTDALNFGLDFSVLNNRLTMSFDVYKMNTSDLLINRGLPSVSGYTSVMSNLGEVENKGFEISANSVNIQHKDFKWETAFNFSLNRNQIKHLYGDMIDVFDKNGNVIGQREADDVTNRRFIGKDINVIWDYRTLGVWQMDEAEEAKKYGCQPGDFKLEDIHDIESRKMTNDDKQFIGYKTPRFRWTLRNDFQYKQFDFSFSLYSMWGHMDEYNISKHQNFLGLDRLNYIQLPYWTENNPINDYARLNSSSGGYGGYNVYRDRSFIRLDNISLSYSVPKYWLAKVGIENMKLNVSARNVAVWAPHWDYFDPETKGDTGTTIIFGLNVTL